VEQYLGKSVLVNEHAKGQIGQSSCYYADPHNTTALSLKNLVWQRTGTLHKHNFTDRNKMRSIKQETQHEVTLRCKRRFDSEERLVAFDPLRRKKPPLGQKATNWNDASIIKQCVWLKISRSVKQHVCKGFAKYFVRYCVRESAEVTTCGTQLNTKRKLALFVLMACLTTLMWLFDCYCLIFINWWAGNVARMGERRVQGFGGETWGKETTGETQT
jgi:hypothetical protein